MSIVLEQIWIKLRWVFLGLCLLALFLARPNQELVLFFFCLTFICFLLCRWHPSDPIFKILLVSYLLRLLMLYIRTSPWFASWSNIILGDEIGYEAGAAKYASMLRAGNFSGFLGDIRYYTYHIIISIPYTLFGRIPNLIRMFNAIINTITIYYIYLIANKLFGQKAAKMAGWVYCFWPSTLFSFISMCRDALTLFAVVVFIWLAIKLMEGKSLSGFVKLGLCALLLYLLRCATLFVTMLVFIGPFIGYFKGNKSSLRKKVFIAFCLSVIIGIGSLLVIKFMAGKLTYQALMKQRRDWGGSAYLQDIVLDSPYSIIKYSLLGGLHFFFGPFLWELKTGPMFLTFLGSTLPIILLFIFAIKPWQQLKNQQPALAWGFLIFFIISGLGFGLFEGNYGAAVRHRDQFVWLLVVMASPQLRKIYDNIKLIKES